MGDEFEGGDTVPTFKFIPRGVNAAPLADPESAAPRRGTGSAHSRVVTGVIANSRRI
jgi:hypothetical protein